MQWRRKVLDFEAWKRDGDPQPKIGHIAMALERRGEPTERGQLRREAVARDLVGSAGGLPHSGRGSMGYGAAGGTRNPSGW